MPLCDYCGKDHRALCAYKTFDNLPTVKAVRKDLIKLRDVVDKALAKMTHPDEEIVVQISKCLPVLKQIVSELQDAGWVCQYSPTMLFITLSKEVKGTLCGK